ncbi:MAG TPA: hypothetical protein VG455_13060 [Acidimicrobiales bacterium]|nr:hypothetical protein [Acidimicrobiales bacterium]
MTICSQTRRLRARQRVGVLLAVAVLTTSACADGDEAKPGGNDATTSVPATDAPTTTTLPGGRLVRCSNAQGFSIARPESWHVNDGSTVAPCSQFHTEPFQVPAGTDERVAAVTAYVERVSFAPAVVAPGEEAERAPTVLDGLQAVRMSYDFGPGARYPAGTPVTRYVVDLAVDLDDDPATLFIDTVGTPQFDYESNVVVLDRMARTLRIAGDDEAERADVVASYRGGGGGFTVEGQVRGSQACLRIPPGGERACTDIPREDELVTIELTNLQPILAGVVGADVFGVTAERRDGEPSTVLPTPIPGSGVAGFAFTFGLDTVERLRLFDITGNELGVVEPGG